MERGRLATALWEPFAGRTLAEMPEDARIVARQCVLDWFGCALAGAREPLFGILLDEFAGAATGHGQCSLLAGSEHRVGPLVAALLNGAAGHALDFDDALPVMGGHPTVPVLPAALAQGEAQGASGAEVLAAFLVGVEIETALGQLVGPGPYAEGWHLTSTYGVFGAAAAACHLMGSNQEQFGHALGLAGSQASGLKVNFGTMTKPFHAGHAAERGLLAARLAMRGFTANPEVVEGAQGIAQAMGQGIEALRWERLADLGERFRTRDVLFKYHAACYLTHAAIESAGQLRTRLQQEQASVDAIEQIRIDVHPLLLGVCGIETPTTGLEAKFSLRSTTAMRLLGIDTTAAGSFVDATLENRSLQELTQRVEVRTTEEYESTQARVEIVGSGFRFEAFADTGVPAADLEAQEEKLVQKFHGLAGPVLGAAPAQRLEQQCLGLEQVAQIGDLF